MSEVNFSTDSGSPIEAAAVAEESAKVEAARAELYDEAAEDSGLILGKYQSTEDLATAYQNLQREYNRLRNGQTAEEPVPVDDGAEEPEDQEAESGVDQGRVDPAVAAAIQQRVLEQAGGEAEYKRLANWAMANLPPERVNAYNDALARADEGAILNSLKGLQYDFMMKNGYEPKLSGGRAPSNEVKGFTSRYQVQQAMSDPRYEHDSGYRRDVERRIAASPDTLFGYQS